MKKSKKVIRINRMLALIFVIIVIILIIKLISTIVQSNKKEASEEILKQYISYIEEKQYENMYDMLTPNSKNSITRENFIERNKNIYEGIEANNISIEIKETTKEKEKATISYKIQMETLAGSVSFENKANMVKENKEYKIEWTSNDIFPYLKEEDKVKVNTTVAGKRGEIQDRNGKVLAGEGTTSSVGIVPGKMSENKKEDIKKIAQLLEISEENINKQMSASYVKEDTFVPIKTVSKTDQELKNKLLEIKGIKISDAKGRVYPYGEKTAHLVGYMQNINAEELEELKKEGYNSDSIIGKSGIEKLYEKRLKGKNGCEITIVDKDNKLKRTIAKKEAQDGETIKLTIDIDIQTKLYDQFKNDKSAQVAINYKTGEILALVSTPSFDSNDFSIGISSNKWNELKQNKDNPLYNRYRAAYAPGSSFKPIIGAIGLNKNKFSVNENFGRSGTIWQKDSSWGSYNVTTIKEYNEEANLRNALIYSDNIYFAKAALKIGKDTLQEELLKLGFSEDNPIDKEITKSTFADNNKIETEVQLADTGYGQGKTLVNPIHMASIYTSFLNEGNMILPRIECKENNETQIWKEQVFTKEIANEMKENLIQIVESEQGTAHEVRIEGKTIGGKTGTAEIKTSKEDKEGTEIGWFNSFYEDKEILIISMVEDVKNRRGSHYILPKIKTIYQNI